MAVTKRTISMSTELAKQVEQIAKKEKTSFSGALSILAEEAIRKRKRRFRSWGAGEGPGDLSIRYEEYLKESMAKAYERESGR